MDEIVHYGGEEIKQGHRDEFDPDAPKDGVEEIPGKPGLKPRHRRHCNTSSG